VLITGEVDYVHFMGGRDRLVGGLSLRIALNQASPVFLSHSSMVERAPYKGMMQVRFLLGLIGAQSSVGRALR
jgi:hypothetical protein